MVCYPGAELVVQIDEFPSEGVRYQKFIPEVLKDFDMGI